MCHVYDPEPQGQGQYHYIQMSVIRVRSLTQICMKGFRKKLLAGMFTRWRQCVAYDYGSQVQGHCLKISILLCSINNPIRN